MTLQSRITLDGQHLITLSHGSTGEMGNLVPIQISTVFWLSTTLDGKGMICLVVLRSRHCVRLICESFGLTEAHYSLSNVIMADEKLISFPQYLRYSHKCGIIVFSILSAII